MSDDCESKDIKRDIFIHTAYDERIQRSHGRDPAYTRRVTTSASNSVKERK